MSQATVCDQCGKHREPGDSAWISVLTHRTLPRASAPQQTRLDYCDWQCLNQASQTEANRVLDEKAKRDAAETEAKAGKP